MADTFSCQGRNQVGEATTQVGHHNVAAVQRGGAGDNCRVVVVAGPETAFGAG